MRSARLGGVKVARGFTPWLSSHSPIRAPLANGSSGDAPPMLQSVLLHHSKLRLRFPRRCLLLRAVGLDDKSIGERAGRLTSLGRALPTSRGSGAVLDWGALSKFRLAARRCLSERHTIKVPTRTRTRLAAREFIFQTLAGVGHGETIESYRYGHVIRGFREICTVHGGRAGDHLPGMEVSEIWGDRIQLR